MSKQSKAETKIQEAYDKLMSSGADEEYIALALDTITSSLGNKYGLTDELNNFVSKLTTGYTGPAYAQKIIAEARDLLQEANVKGSQINTIISQLNKIASLSSGNTTSARVKHEVRKRVKGANERTNQLNSLRDSIYDQAYANSQAVNEAASQYGANPTQTNRVALEKSNKQNTDKIRDMMKGVEDYV